MAYILERYAKTQRHRELLNTLWEDTRVLEKRLFSYLDFHPDIIPPALLAAALPS
jgi:hypothetical protein